MRQKAAVTEGVRVRKRIMERDSAVWQDPFLHTMKEKRVIREWKQMQHFLLCRIRFRILLL